MANIPTHMTLEVSVPASLMEASQDSECVSVFTCVKLYIMRLDCGLPHRALVCFLGCSDLCPSFSRLTQNIKLPTTEKLIYCTH